MELSSPNFLWLSDLMDITVLFDMVNKPYCIIYCRVQGILTKYSICIFLKISNLRDVSWTVSENMFFFCEYLSHINVKQKNKICTRQWVNSWKCQFGKTVIRYVLFLCKTFTWAGTQEIPAGFSNGQFSKLSKQIVHIEGTSLL